MSKTSIEKVSRDEWMNTPLESLAQLQTTYMMSVCVEAQDSINASGMEALHPYTEALEKLKAADNEYSKETTYEITFPTDSVIALLDSSSVKLDELTRYRYLRNYVEDKRSSHTITDILNLYGFINNIPLDTKEKKSWGEELNAAIANVSDDVVRAQAWTNFLNNLSNQLNTMTPREGDQGIVNESK